MDVNTNTINLTPGLVMKIAAMIIAVVVVIYTFVACLREWADVPLTIILAAGSFTLALMLWALGAIMDDLAERRR